MICSPLPDVSKIRAKIMYILFNTLSPSILLTQSRYSSHIYWMNI